MTEPKSMHCGRTACHGITIASGDVAYPDCECTCGACREAQSEFFDKIEEVVLHGPEICVCDSGNYCKVHPPDLPSDN